MEYLMTGVMTMLGLSILGTFGLIMWVAWYIYSDIQKDKESYKHSPLKPCEWKSKECVYSTGCGEEFYDASESGNPVTDWLNYCPYCGRKVKER